MNLPELPLSQWEPTKTTLHLWTQIVGKVRLAVMPPRNHWWHVPLYVDVRGLTTRRMHTAAGGSFQIDFDFLDHRLHVRTSAGADESFPLHDGLSVASFDTELHALLGQLDLDVAIREEPFGVPQTTPFPEDREHATYDPDAIVRFWRILDWTDSVFDEFSGWFAGKTSPIHLFWHSLDLAVTRFGGRAAPVPPEADTVTREAYSHEVISFGFWPGDEQTSEPGFYSYTSPAPRSLRDRPLEPSEAQWTQRLDGSFAFLPYEAVRTNPDPHAALLTFLESAYAAGADAAGWPVDELQSEWHPNRKAPTQL